MDNEEKKYFRDIKMALRKLSEIGVPVTPIIKAVMNAETELRESEDERIIDGFRTLLDGISRKGGLTLNKVPLQKCYAYLEKQKESLHISETCKEKADSFTDEDEMIRQTLLDYFSKYSHICMWGNFTRDQIVAYLESLKEQKPLTVEDVVEQSRRFGREVEIIQKSSLEEAAEEYRRNSYNASLIPPTDGPTPDYGYSVIDAFIAGAEYQRKQDQSLIELAEDHAMLAGMNKMKEEMMEKAVEGYVNYYKDSGGILMAEAQVGCPYHNGDKVKIIVIKEEK